MQHPNPGPATCTLDELIMKSQRCSQVTCLQPCLYQTLHNAYLVGSRCPQRRVHIALMQAQCLLRGLRLLLVSAVPTDTCLLLTASIPLWLNGLTLLADLGCRQRLFMAVGQV
jgi:hypothetical protein